MHAGVEEGAFGGSLNLEIFAGIGDASDEFAFEERDLIGEASYEDTVVLADESDRGAVDATAEVYLGYFSKFLRQTSGLTGLDFVTLSGNQRSRVDFAGGGYYLDMTGISGIFTSISPGNELWQTFTITEDGPEVASITVALNSLKETGSLTRLAIQKNNGGTWTNVAIYQSTGYYSYHEDTRSLDPGEYRIHCSMPTSAATGNDGSFSIAEGIVYEITFGSPLIDLKWPEEEDYTHPLVGTEFTDSPKLQILNPGIVSEVDLGDGTTEITFTANLVNSSFCPWSYVDVSVRAARAGEPEVTAVNSGTYFARLEALSTTAPGRQGIITVANEDLDTVRAGILDGSRLTTNGTELIVFRYPVVLVEPGLIPPQRLQSQTMEFYGGGGDNPSLGEPPFEPGQIVIEWEPYFSVPPRLVPDGMGGENLVQNFDKDLPILVRSVHLEPGTIQQPQPYYVVSGEPLTFQEIIKHGTVRHPVANPLPGYTRNATEGSEIEEQKHFPIPILLTLNRLKFDDILHVSGDFNFIPGEFEVEYALENGALLDFLVRKSYTAEVNLLIETANHEEVGGSPIVDEEKTLLDVNLFTVALPGGFTFSAGMDLEVGATANVTRSLSVPFTTRYTVDVVAGVKDGIPYYDDSTTYVPLHVSDPNLFEEIGVDIDVWIDAELRAGLGFPSAVTSSYVTTGARLDGHFGVHPLADPWWDLSADLSLTAGFELDMGIFFKLVDLEHPLSTITLFEREAGGPLLPGFRNLSYTLPPEGLNPGIPPLTDPTARWMRGLQQETAVNAPGAMFLIPLAGTTDILTGHGGLMETRFSRIDAEGRLLRTLECPSNTFQVQDAISLDDGGALLLESGNKIDLVWLDADLEMVDSARFNFGSLTYRNLRLARNATHFFVLGDDYFENKRQPILSCFTLAGDPVWSRSYTVDPAQYANPADLVVTADGNVVFCATTSADFADEEGLEGIVINITPNGLLAKLDAATGDVLWAKLIAHTDGPDYNAIAESPIGELTIGGTYGMTYPSSEPSMMLTQFSSTGDMLEGLRIGYTGSDRAAANPNGDGLIAPIPHGGETYYDEIYDLVWSEEGLWACGKIGLYHPTSILSTGSSGFTIFFDPALNPARYALHGGLSADDLQRIIVTDSGPLATGSTNSFFPWPYGASDETDNTPWAQWLLKLPWEGRLDFHSLSGAAQPDPEDPAPLAGSFFVYPRVVSGLLSGDLDINDPQYDSYGQGPERISDADRGLIVNDLVLSEEALTVTFSEGQIEDYKALEYIPRSRIVDSSSYLAWNQMEPGEDVDGDGLGTDAEFFFGTDVLTADKMYPEIISIFPLVLGVPRNKLAADALPVVWESNNLIDWDPIVPASTAVWSLDALRDVVELEIPSEISSNPRFFIISEP